MKCRFCHYENEEGALFCERCTSDLKEPVEPLPQPFPVPPPMAEPVREQPPLAFEAIPVAQATPVESVPLAPVTPLPPLNLSPLEPAAPIKLEPIQRPIQLTPAPPPTVPTASVPTTSPANDKVGILPHGAEPRLLVLRGLKRNVEYPLYEGLNFIGRADEKPVDIDLEEQEPPDRIWCSRQHACITFENNQLVLEDLNSANGTYVNRTRVYPNQKRQLNINDIIQIGNVQLKVIL